MKRNTSQIITFSITKKVNVYWRIFVFCFLFHRVFVFQSEIVFEQTKKVDEYANAIIL